ncbi:hypothetical protein [Solicola sp. PLA-1-18]|uniref:hypothetical protein n=1 Tax=Solicola sp. PLA-1-18 TaxID=3380532 RepID=UPI003B7A5C67
MDLEEIYADLSAFADEEGDAHIDEDGSFILVRGGRELSGRFWESDSGTMMVDYQGSQVPYRRFLTHQLAGLDTFAERIVARRAPVYGFVDSPVELYRASSDPTGGSSLSILQSECASTPPFASRITFITADAGHGKTALLREHQQRQAQAFLSGEGSYVFWHLDLQGRQLLRLSEALMGDLGDMRITGLWMPAIVRLMRRKALVLAIDGFDELAAEQGGTNALGALASLVSQLRGRGCVVAAARRTFFDTEDYLRRSGVVKRGLTSPCQFNQIALMPWGRNEGVAYLANAVRGSAVTLDPETTYTEILNELGADPGHPMLARPFLLAQIVRGVAHYGLTPADFIHTADDPLSGVAAVVEAFVKREVSDKWKFRDTGEAYLTVEQHLGLLADIAEEMFRSQRDRLDLELVETIAALLLDQWGVEPERRQQILQMVRTHVLLVIPSDGDSAARSFDHPEFRDYFVAYALRIRLESAMSGNSSRDIARFMSVAQLSDGTARYVCGMVDRVEPRVRRLTAALQTAVRDEWKPTYLQSNVGTLLPFVLDGVEFETRLEFDGKVVFSSLVFERTVLSNVTFKNAALVNSSLRGVAWSNVLFVNCTLGELLLDNSSSFENVSFRECSIDGLRIQTGDGEEVREYAPDRIRMQLAMRGIADTQPELPNAADVERNESPKLRILRRVLRVYNRTTIMSDEQLQMRFKHDVGVVMADLIPFMVEHGVLEERKWKGSGNHRAWSLSVGLDELLAAEGGLEDDPLVKFWERAAGL